MFILDDVLTPQDVRAFQEVLAAAPFRDGRATAGPAAGKVKLNAQARGDDPSVAALGRRARLALEAHPTMRSLVRPVRWSNLIFSRYGSGQQYGLHADNAAMFDESGWPLRTDVSFTLLLSEPETYEGGELVVHDLTGERGFRPKAGSAIVYPTGHLHRVAPVTRGVRLACVGWLQSLVRRADQREILFDLERLRAKSDTEDGSLILDKTIGNLLRMWSDG